MHALTSSLYELCTIHYIHTHYHSYERGVAATTKGLDAALNEVSFANFDKQQFES
jgi:hypothetical protein